MKVFLKVTQLGGGKEEKEGGERKRNPGVRGAENCGGRIQRPKDLNAGISESQKR